MDEYNDGYRPPSSEHKKDPRSLVNAKPEFGGNERPGYPKGFSKNPENKDDPQWAKLHGTFLENQFLWMTGEIVMRGLGTGSWLKMSLIQIMIGFPTERRLRTILM